MRYNNTKKHIAKPRNLTIPLVVSGAIFWAIACAPDPSTTNQSVTTNQSASLETAKRAANHSSESIKIDNAVFASVQEFAESSPVRCASVPPPPDEREKIEMRLQELEKTNFAREAAGPIRIAVYFHIITNAAGTEGNVSDAAVQLQLQVLNDAFAGIPGGAPTSFRFDLAAKPDVTKNDAWFNMEYSEVPNDIEKQAKAKLNNGDNKTLNIYTVRLANKPFGWGRFPWQLADKVDGIVIRYSTLPGGATNYFNQGDTAVHETGHWLGLYHTFENGCSLGDYVDDTNAEDSAATYCPVARDTCPAPGPDPVQNYMDFTWDSCMNEFTTGQAVRMTDMYQQYRK